MCLAVYQGHGEEIPEEYLENGWYGNPDGGGYAFINGDGKPHIKKGYYTFPDWMRDYEKDWEEYGKHSSFILHFRIATHGTKGPMNTHPHQVDDDTVVAHNGIIPVPMKKKDVRSDTLVFVEEVLRNLPSGWMDQPALWDMVSDYITGSKLVFLTTDPDYEYGVYLMHADDGHWLTRKTGEKDEKGKDIEENREVWFSNRSFRVSRRYKKHTGWGGWEGGWEDGYGGLVHWLQKNDDGEEEEDEDPDPRSITEGGCYLCRGDVDMEYYVCTYCLTCQICEEWAGDCECWGGESELRDSYIAKNIWDMTDEEWQKSEGGLYLP